MIKILAQYCFLPFALYSSSCLSNESPPFLFNQAFYLGFQGGYGSTTWEGLVPTKNNQNPALNLSTPIKVTEGGGVWGLFAGYEFIPAFALELNYMRYPKAKVFFDPMSLFSFDNDSQETLLTKTETMGLMGKVMLPIAQTCFKIYSSAGIAAVHRKDIISNHWRLSPSFGAGINYRISRHLMAELAGNYTAGFGESQLSPADTYFPFLYSIVGRIAFRF